MHTIDLATADYAGGFNVSERDGDMSVSSFAQPGGGPRKPRTRSAAHTTDCLVTRADGTRYRIAKGTRKASGRKRASVTTTRATVAPETSRVVSSYDARHALSY
jgi:hypothetical protein